MVEVHVASGRHLFGDEHTGWSEAEVRGRRSGDSPFEFVDMVAVDGEGAVVGMLALALPQLENTDQAWLMLAVDPQRRRDGVGSVLLRATVDAAREYDRSLLLVETEWAAGQDDGSGEFARGNGFRAVQTMIRSGMPLPADVELLRRVAENARRGDPRDYLLEVAHDLPPESWLAGLAVLRQRMSTDAPLGEMDAEEEVWDVARVRAEYDWARDVGRRVLTTVARRAEDGVMVGFTEVQLPSDEPGVAYQQDTLVLREARGHGLGQRLKALTALEVMEVAPQARVVRTWNADDNTPMLAVNTELGYRPEGYQRSWQRRLTD